MTTKTDGLIIGSVVFLFLGIVAAIGFHIYVGMRSPPSAKSANQKYPLWKL